MMKTPVKSSAGGHPNSFLILIRMFFLIVVFVIHKLVALFSGMDSLNI